MTAVFVVLLGTMPIEFAVSDGARASSIAEPFPEAGADDWRGLREAWNLPDGSRLTEYTAESPALDGSPASLRVGFIPRFACSPTISLLIASEWFDRLSSGPVDSDSSDDDGLRLVIDGAPTAFPAIVDDEGDRKRVAYAGGERERLTLRLQIDVGDRAEFALDGGASIAFSLLGSRKSLAAIETLCRQHPPVPFEPAAK